MPDGTAQIEGRWFRWSSYTLLNGVIVPAKRAQLESYDPWEGFRDNAGKYRTVDQPYVALLELARNWSEDAVLDWCARHGLLGIVPVTSTEIVLPATKQGFQPRYVRRGGQWADQSARWNLSKGAPPGMPEPGAIMEALGPGTLHGGGTRHVTLDYLQPYFGPHAPACPGSEAFQGTYGEPLEHFARWTKIFADCVTWMDDERPVLADLMTGQLDRLAQSAAPTFTREGGRLVEKRASAGLLASYALMHLWDRMEKRRAFACPVCGRNFVSNAQEARYCSTRCRNTAQRRAYREKTKTKLSVSELSVRERKG